MPSTYRVMAVVGGVVLASQLIGLGFKMMFQALVGP